MGYYFSMEVISSLSLVEEKSLLVRADVFHDLATENAAHFYVTTCFACALVLKPLFQTVVEERFFQRFLGKNFVAVISLTLAEESLSYTLAVETLGWSLS